MLVVELAALASVGGRQVGHCRHCLSIGTGVGLNDVKAVARVDMADLPA